MRRGMATDPLAIGERKRTEWQSPAGFGLYADRGPVARTSSGFGRLPHWARNNKKKIAAQFPLQVSMALRGGQAVEFTFDHRGSQTWEVSP
jgi:hypothetical protein